MSGLGERRWTGGFLPIEKPDWELNISYMGRGGQGAGGVNGGLRFQDRSCDD